MIKQGNGFYIFKNFSLHPSMATLVPTKVSGNSLPLKNKDFRPKDKGLKGEMAVIIGLK